MKRILYHGDSPTVATGFGNVSNQLLSNLLLLDPDLDITVIGINDRGGYKDPKKYPYPIYPALYDDMRDPFGMKRLSNTLQGTDPEIQGQFDTLFLQYDLFLLSEIKLGENSLIDWIKAGCEKSGIKKKIIYTPIDNHQMKPEWIESLKFFDHIIVPSYYGKRIIESYDKELGKRTRVVYYSVESDIFKPLSLEEKKANRVGISNTLGINISDRFVIGFVGRNQWRKDIYRLVKIFAEFKRNHPEAYLYIHTKPDDLTSDGGNLMDLLYYQKLYAGKDYLFPFNLNQNRGITREQLNEFYNLMDVYMSCSVGEGFGLPYLEAMAAGVPVIAPNNTTVPELLNTEALKKELDLQQQVKQGRGLIFKTNNTVCFGQVDQMRERQLGDITDGVDTLEFMYNNRDRLEDMRKKAMEFAHEFTPKRMAKEIYEVLCMQ